MASDQDRSGAAFAFGSFRLLPHRQLLLRDGLPVRIGGRALDILTLLVRRAGEVVSKNDLLAYGWPGMFVHESNLKVNVAALRRVLGDGVDAAYIATIAGRGYRFVAPVAIEADEAPTPLRAPPRPPRSLLRAPRVIGRDEEIERIAVRLDASRCVTIVGPGGVGKTTVALAVAHRVMADFPDGVCFVDLSTVGDPQYATAAIAAGVGAKPRSEDTLSEIIEVIHERRMLLILDNCEHLLTTLSGIADRLLLRAPTLTLLATSREPLRNPHEMAHRLPSLALPAADPEIPAREAMEYGAVALFVARAAERGGYVVSDDDVPLIAAICRRLDGIPLAIELVATKVAALGLPTLLTMLEAKFLTLSNGERSAPLRQQTLLATLDWSYQLLAEDEAALLRRISVFAGVFPLSDAVAMTDGPRTDAAGAIEALERLASKSLVCVDYRNGALTCRLLESTRAYAAERLQDAGEQPRALELHACHILAMFERASDELDMREKPDWMADYADRIDDLRNAMAWAFGPTGDRMLGIRLTAAAIPLWYELSSLSEMQSRVERALLAARDRGDCPKVLTLKLVAARASGMTFAQHLALATEAAWLECYELGVEAGNAKYQLFGLWGLSAHLIYIGRPLEGMERLKTFIDLAREQADWAAVDEGYRSLSVAEIYVGRIASGRRRLEGLAAPYDRPSEPLRLARFQGERGVTIRCSLSLALWVSGDPGRAMQVARAAVERAEVSGHVVSHSNALAVFAVPIAVWTGDIDGAEEFLARLEDNSRREDIGIWREVHRFWQSAVRAKRRVPGAAFEMKARFEDMIAARNLLRAAMHCSMVAEALLEAGELDEARGAIERARAFAAEQAANWCLPEIDRIAGLVALRSGDATGAERLLRHAIADAAAIGADTFELRAGLALAAMLEADGRVGDARRMLAASAAKFAAAAPYGDLREARARLQRLDAVDGDRTLIG